MNERLKRPLRRFLKNIIILMFLMSPALLYGQESQVTGTILDELGNSVPGVNVIIKDKGAAAVSDINGKFSAKCSSTDVLVFSFIGYQTQEIAVGAQTSINVILKEDVKLLNEVVVIGYGVQKKSDLTGAVASVKAEEVARIPSAGLESALQGKAAGVQVSQNTGQPGSAVKIRIRGISSISSVGGEPIWIVDGVGAPANSVNMNDIESIEILKDASSAAIYGSNGANGVILVTTKKGKAGKTEANLNYYRGVQTLPKQLDMADGPTFAKMYSEYQALLANGNNIASPKFPNPDVVPTHNYQDLIFRDAIMNNLDFNISGGTDKFNSYFGLGYVKQEGTLKATDYEKINARLKSEYQINKWLKIGENASYTQTKRNGWEDWQYGSEYGSPVTSAVTVHPYLPPYDSTGNWSARTLGNTDSPMAAIDLLNNEKRNYSGNGSFYVVVTPLKGLSIESRFNTGIGFNRDYSFSPVYYYGAGAGQNNTTNSVYRKLDYNFNYGYQNLVTYNTTVLKDFNLGVVVGNEGGHSEGMDIYGTRRQLINETAEMQYFDASKDDTSKTQFVKGGAYENAGYSYLGRLNLDYKSKYLFQFNVRKDYSSKFGPNNRSGIFPGGSLGWKFSEEDFIKNNLTFLSFGKLRYALGRAGNNAVRDYAYFATVGRVNGYKYSLDNTTSLRQGAAPDVLPNLSIKWEDIETQNIGVDLGFLDNKLNVSVEKYQRHNIGMLITTTIPGFAGWTVRDVSQESGGVDPRPVENVGKLTNKGWEVTLGWKDNIGELKYSVDVVYSYVKNTATDLGKDSVRRGGSFLGLTNISRTETGGELGDFYGFKVERIFQVADTGTLPNGKRGITNQPSTVNDKGVTVYAQPGAQPGDFKFKDLNGDGKITDKDQTIIGNPFAKHEFSFNFNFEYKWFDLSMMWQGVAGNKIFNCTKFYGLNQSGLYNWSTDYVNNHYREKEIVAKDASGTVFATYAANTNAKYPRLDPLNKNGNFDKVSDFYVEDGSYLRLKNIQLGVNLPEKWVNKLTLSQFRVYIGAKNLLTFTKYTGIDPEVTQNDPLVAGYDKSAYPQPRTFILGASIKF